MILGRESEQERLRSLVTRTLSGEGGTLVIVGDPGMGKTTILDWARKTANREQLSALQAGGRESESDLPFVVLADLLHPLEGRIDSLPGPQRRALRTALALSDAAAGDRLAVNAAALRLIGDHVADEPLLLLIDDYQWLDTATKDVVDFISRRSQAVGVGMVIASRGALPGEHGGEVLRLAPLADGAATALVREVSDLSPTATRRVLDLAAGNPLALVELSRVPPSERSGDAAISVTAALQRAFGRQLDEISARARLAVLCVAEEESGGMGAVSASLTNLGLSTSDLDEAVAAGLLISEGETIRFRHPLVRSVAHATADPGDVSRIHRAIAESVGDPDLRAWHLAAAASSPDEDAAEALDAVAERALARGAAAAAAAALRKGATLSRERATRFRRLAAAARAAHHAGNLDLTAELISEARAADSSPNPALLLLDADIRMRRGEFASAYATLRLEASKAAALDPARAATMILVASKFRVQRLEADQAMAEVEQALAMVPEHKHETVHRAAVAMAQTMAGHEKARASVQLAAESALASPYGHIHSLAIGWPLVWLEEYELAAAFLGRSVEIQREGGFLAYLPQALLPLAELEYRTGHWDDARLHATEALQLFEELAQPTEAAFAAPLLARIEAGFGDESSARLHARSAIETDVRSGLNASTASAEAALGLLELGLGNFEEAAAHLEESRLLCERHGTAEPNLFPVEADLVEALVRIGDKDNAMLIAKSATARGEAMSRTSVAAAGHRAIGIAADEEDFRDHFEIALDIHQHLPTPFETARTELAYGERLRRVRKREEARRHLRRALRIFEALGALPWSGRARSELELSGETLDQPRSFASLTRQERQVATIVARGATNREAAATLFVNHKTIEFHLGNVYRKLGVRSRTELANLLATRPPVESA